MTPAEAKKRLEEIREHNTLVKPTYDKIIEGQILSFKNSLHADIEFLLAHIDQQNAAIEVAMGALEKIADPRKRGHREPDKYTEVGCMMNIAEEALAKLKEGRP